MALIVQPKGRTSNIATSDQIFRNFPKLRRNDLSGLVDTGM